MVKYIKDYYEQVYEMFPDVPKSDIQRILNYGWKQMYLINSYGCDVEIEGPGFWTYFGKMTKSSMRHFFYYKNKLAIKLKILYKRKKIKWDGYYYFAIGQKQYESFGLKSTGRPRKWFTFKNIKLYKIYEECRLRECNKRYIYRIPFLKDFFWQKLFRELKTDKAELIEARDSVLKFKDILVTNHDYGLGNSE